jgi:DNA-binding CsgD family transcriptional regulator
MPKTLKNFVPVVGFENYLVDPTGRVFSLDSNILLKPIKQTTGYFSVNLYKNRKVNPKTIHRLVAINFIPNPENKKQVNHINGIKTDNRLCNLEWNTPKENIKHSRRIGLKVEKLSVADVYEIWKRVNNPVHQTAKEFGVAESSIRCIYNGTHWEDIYEEHKHLKPKKHRWKSDTVSLTPEEIQYIRDTEETISSRQIAKKFGISQYKAWSIRARVGRYRDI